MRPLWGLSAYSLKTAALSQCLWEAFLFKSIAPYHLKQVIPHLGKKKKTLSKLLVGQAPQDSHPSLGPNCKGDSFRSRVPHPVLLFLLVFYFPSWPLWPLPFFLPPASSVRTQVLFQYPSPESMWGTTFPTLSQGACSDGFRHKCWVLFCLVLFFWNKVLLPSCG